MPPTAEQRRAQRANRLAAHKPDPNRARRTERKLADNDSLLRCPCLGNLTHRKGTAHETRSIA
jgi:hypothetical protein